MIWDSFLYNGEDRLLEIRLHELAPVVDGFIVVEANTTFSGKSKPFSFDIDKWKDFNIDYVGINLPLKGKISDAGATQNEILQRNGINRLLLDKLDDLVIISDLDEIPQRNVVRNLVRLFDEYPDVKPVKIKLKTCYYYLNQEGPAPFCGYGPIVAKVADVLRATPQLLRVCIYSPDMPSADGGWHFTYLGDIIKKLGDVAHHGPDHRDKYIAAIKGDVGDLKVFTEPLPYLVREQPEKFKDWLVST